MKQRAYLLRQVGAEFLGTYALVTTGCGAIVVNSQTGALSHLGVALTFGLVITVMIVATGHLSGAHFNPAVTLALASIRRFPWRDVPFYIIGQLLGAILGAFTLRLLFGLTASLGATLPQGDPIQSLGMEFLMTAGLMFVITAVATDPRVPTPLAALAIGATVALGALWGGPISGASMNPARSFGPALVAGAWSFQWIYWLGPITGAVLGALIYQLIRLPPVQSELSPSTIQPQVGDQDARHHSFWRYSCKPPGIGSSPHRYGSA
jgi:aquaporin NIP